MTTRLELVDPVVDERWAQLVEGRRSDVFHSPQWLRVVGETYGFKLVGAVLSVDSDAPHAGMVYAEVEDHMDPRIVSIPFSDFCDPLVGDLSEWRQIVDPLVAGGRRVHVKCLRSRVPMDDERFQQTGRLLWHAIDTTRDLDEIWMALDTSARRAIRKARQQGLEIKAADGLDDVRAFFEMHLKVRKTKYHLLAQPFEFFERIWDTFLEPGSGALLMATIGDEVLGGVLFLEWGDTLYYKFNASAASTLSIRPNDFVVWAGIEEARRRGLSWLDFGVSDEDQEGLVRYKRKYATHEQHVVALAARPEGSPSRREQVARRLLNDLTSVLVDPQVPDSVTERAGDLLYRYFT